MRDSGQLARIVAALEHHLHGDRVEVDTLTAESARMSGRRRRCMPCGDNRVSTCGSPSSAPSVAPRCWTRRCSRWSPTGSSNPCSKRRLRNGSNTTWSCRPGRQGHDPHRRRIGGRGQDEPIRQGSNAEDRRSHVFWAVMSRSSSTYNPFLARMTRAWSAPTWARPVQVSMASTRGQPPAESQPGGSAQGIGSR